MESYNSLIYINLLLMFYVRKQAPYIARLYAAPRVLHQRRYIRIHTRKRNFSSHSSEREKKTHRRNFSAYTLKRHRVYGKPNFVSLSHPYFVHYEYSPPCRRFPLFNRPKFQPFETCSSRRVVLIKISLVPRVHSHRAAEGNGSGGGGSLISFHSSL